MSWWHYLLLVNLYLVLFFVFYRIFLDKETFFQLNRAYLIAGSVLSFVIPVMQSDWIRQLFITQRVHQTIYATVNPQFIYQVKPVESNPLTLGQIIALVYILGAVALLCRLIYQLYLVKAMMRETDAPAAFSFFKKIRVSTSLPNQQTIIEHEQVHTRQWHSADVLLIEAVMIINWFNPVVYFYRKAVKRVHEYIADRKAIETGTSKTEYALLLLSQTFGTVPQQLTNNFFNHSLLKQRIMMLNQNQSRRRALLKYGLSAPLFAAMLVFSSATVNNSNIIRVINKKTEQAFAINAIHFKAEINDSTSTITVASTSGSELKKGSLTFKQTSSIVSDVNKGSAATTVQKDSVSLQVFNAVEIQPTFPGGERGFGKFLVQNIHYPDKAKANNTKGRVFIQFVVEADGDLSDIKCLRDPGDGLGQEAMRVLSISPKWMPGIQNGKRVRVQYTVPVNFSLIDDAYKKPEIDSVRVTATSKKPMTLFLYKYQTGDSTTLTANGSKQLNHKTITTIKMNGKIITADELKGVDLKNIENISVIKADTAKGAQTNSNTNFIIIKTKTAKGTSKG
ncbi:TonB family protein [Mucilaginibacter gracilis]|uniref:TonB family protein n=2 Tax=Mucilaginibacter gracilis TaxID=423350 RepID=A0A495IWG0_9SPHI|nr:TonB family protein [Mucilaginibacter gracilis]